MVSDDLRAFGPRDVQRHHRCLAGVSRAVYSVQCTVCSSASWTHYYPTLSILLSILLDFLVAMNLLSRKTCARPPPRCLCIPHLSLDALPPSSTSVPILYSSTMSVTRDGCCGRGTHSSRRLRSTSEFPSWLQMSLITRADRTQIALSGIPIARSPCHGKTGTRRVPDTRVRDVGLSRDERGCGRHVASHPGCDPRGQGLGVSRVEAARARTRRVKESSSRLGRNFRGLRQVPERGI